MPRLPVRPAPAGHILPRKPAPSAVPDDPLSVPGNPLSVPDDLLSGRTATTSPAGA
ncbi:hypothetical protein GCM10027615_79720 [Plantactinospora veratri]